MPYNSETETFYQAPATVVDSTPDGDTVQEGFDDRLTPALAGVYADFNLLKADGMISVGIPATTTARGIGRVATTADAAVGSTITNGPAFLDAETWKVSATPAAGIIPLADGSGTIDSWLAGYTKTDQSNVDTSKANVVLQRQCTITGAMATGSTLIPADNTIPQSTEGDQYMTLTYTPKSASSKIRVDVVAYVSSNSGVGVWGALFLDSATSAFAAGVVHMGTTGAVNPLVISAITNSTDVSAHTIKLRMGSGTGGSGVTFNGSGGSQYMGGTFSSCIMLTEYAA